jgi:hypothetical protein
VKEPVELAHVSAKQTWAVMGGRRARHLGRQKGQQPEGEASDVCYWDVDEIAYTPVPSTSRS